MTADASRLRTALQAWQRRVFEDAALGMLAGADVPVQSGETLQSGEVVGFVESQTSVSAVLSWPTPQAKWSNDGTRPHRIEGNPLLSFYWPAAGRRVVVRSVNHPGNRPGRWVENSVTDQRWAEALDRAMGRTQLGSS